MAEGVTMEAYVSLATNNDYCHGAIALACSLRLTNTSRKLCLLISEKVTDDMREKLEKVWDEMIVIEEITSGDEEKLALIKRPELGVTFSKLHIWRLVHYSKCVFLDADTLVLTNVDELFEREEMSAAPDIGWPDLFNSGVFVFRPSLETFASLLELADKEGSYDGGDQGLLNLYWSDWSTRDAPYRLPFTYNVVANITYSYPPAFLRHRKDMKIIHFLGAIKPWHHRYIPSDGSIIMHPGADQSHYGAEEFIRKWWETYHKHHSLLGPHLTGEIQHHEFSSPFQPSDGERKASWERQAPDYHGVDQSDSVMAHIKSQVD